MRRRPHLSLKDRELIARLLGPIRGVCSICGAITKDINAHRCSERSLRAIDAAHRAAPLEPTERRPFWEDLPPEVRP